MNGFSKVIIAGNLTRDPELRYLTSGAAVANFDVAVNRKWKDANGEKKEEVSFVPISVYGKQAEVITQYLKKGRPILIDGRIQQQNWDDKATGQKRSKLGVVLESFTFLDSGKDGGERQEPRETSPAPSSSGLPSGPEEDTGDIPFRAIPRARFEAALTGVAIRMA